LREPLAAARGADALLVPAGAADSDRLARRVGVELAFTVSVDYHALRLVTPFGAAVVQPPRRVLIVAAIARPERFVDAVRELGYSVAQEITFRDHHWFTASEMDHVQQQAGDAGVDAILMTEKDAVRVVPGTGGPVPLMYLPIDARIEPAETFRHWLFERIGPPQVRR
jgi:tetraacyldisaccharide-1-P 4'-kinase